MKKALIAMSGGVDSSVAALFMKEKGYDVIGVTMKLYDNDDINLKEERTCCSLSDIEDARSVAYKVGFPYYVFNFKDCFKECVIDKFVNSYKEGETPNPCIDCNRYLKFARLYERAKALGCDKIVTGHYVRIKYDEKTNKYQLLKGVDSKKDQSYVLYHMTQEMLKHTDFPLGEYSKEEIRIKANEYGLYNADKPDSQDICFIPDGNHQKFIEEYTGVNIGEGNFVDINGKILGKHQGYYKYTIGQRKGLGISAKNPLYVIEIVPEKNQVVLGTNEDLFSNSLEACDFNWIEGETPKNEFLAYGRTRYHEKETRAKVKVLSDKNVKIIFEEPVRAITKGQSVVLYDGDIVLGGGKIFKKL